MHDRAAELLYSGHCTPQVSDLEVGKGNPVAGPWAAGVQAKLGLASMCLPPCSLGR